MKTLKALAIISAAVTLASCEIDYTKNGIIVPQVDGERISLYDGIHYTYNPDGTLLKIEGYADGLFTYPCDVVTHFEQNPFQINERLTMPDISARETSRISDIIQDRHGKIISCRMDHIADEPDWGMSFFCNSYFEYDGNHLVSATHKSTGTETDKVEIASFTWEEVRCCRLIWENGNVIRIEMETDYTLTDADGTHEEYEDNVYDFIYENTRHPARRFEFPIYDLLGLYTVAETALAQLGYYGTGCRNLISRIYKNGQMHARLDYEFYRDGNIACLNADFANYDPCIIEYEYGTTYRPRSYTRTKSSFTPEAVSRHGRTAPWRY